MKFLEFAAAALVTSTCLSAHAGLITNGGFETGTLSGWTAVNNVSGGCGSNAWVVNSTGQHACTRNGTTIPAPIYGSFGAFNTFDGAASPSYMLSQRISLPGSIGRATLAFANAFHMSSYSGAARTFKVDFYDASNISLIANVFSQVAGARANTGWMNQSVDVSAALIDQAGHDVTLRFTEIIPQRFTGAGGFGLDNISLVTTQAVPEPASMALLGLGMMGLFAARRRSPKK